MVIATSGIRTVGKFLAPWNCLQIRVLLSASLAGEGKQCTQRGKESGTEADIFEESGMRRKASGDDSTSCFNTCPYG